MARSDLLISLVKAGVQGDRHLFHRTVDAIIAEERGKQHMVLADQLEEASRKNGRQPLLQPIAPPGPSQALVHEINPKRNVDELMLPQVVGDMFAELVEEQRRADLLRAHGIEPRNRILLIGPPGNGKTSLAEAFAEALGVVLLTVRYESVIGSFLGETAGRLNRLFDSVATRPCVLFFDEFDTLGKERGDVHDTGEIKRVVSSLLLQIDRLPSYVVIVAATNHEELLDRAVWRRFQMRLGLPRPSLVQVVSWFDRMCLRLNVPENLLTKSLAQKLKFESFAEVEEFTLDIKRRIVLAGNSSDARKIVSRRCENWIARMRQK